MQLSPYVIDLLAQENLTPNYRGDYPHRWSNQFQSVRELARRLAERGNVDAAERVYDDLFSRFPLEEVQTHELVRERQRALGLKQTDELTEYVNGKLNQQRTNGDELGEATSLYQLGNLARTHGDFGKARVFLAQSLDKQRVIGNHHGTAQTLLELGRLAKASGEVGEARRFFTESSAIYQKLGLDGDFYATWEELERLDQPGAETDEARRTFQEALIIEQTIRDEISKAEASRASANITSEAPSVEQASDATDGSSAGDEGLRERQDEEMADVFDYYTPGRLKQLTSVFELAKDLRTNLGHKAIGCPVLLASLFDSRADRTTFAFLSSFGITRQRLHTLALKNKPGLSGQFGYTEQAAAVLLAARHIAHRRKTDEVRARHLFAALLDNVREREWLEISFGRDVIGWIGHTLDEWDDAVPITQEAVQAKMVEDDLFANPPTQHDSAADKDLLGFEEHADALVQIITRPETRAPLVIGVYGPWGSGKSTFMALVKRKLDARDQCTDETKGLRAFVNRQATKFASLFKKSKHTLRVTTVDYDAWAYADAPKLWAGLVQRIAKELDAELTAGDRLAYLVNSHLRRLLTALALGIIPIAFFAVGLAVGHVPPWMNGVLSRIAGKPWLNLPAWATATAWAVYAYFLQKRPVTDAVTSLAARFDSTPTVGLANRIQDEFKTALQTKLAPEAKSKSIDARRTDIRQRIQRNELKIVVCIDELDRCPLEKIVEILEAIKLFLAEDIFIVLLGVDTRVAAEASRLHYNVVQNPNLPREYLEKIVQLPLSVPTAGKAHIEKYLQSFMSLPEDANKTVVEGSQTQPMNVPPETKPETSPVSNRDAHIQTDISARPTIPMKGQLGPAITISRTRPETASQLAITSFYDAAALSRDPTLPQLPDTPTEFAVMAGIARQFLDSNPRRIKRLLNTYRYVKILAARLPGTPVHTSEWQKKMLYWLAFTMKWPSFMAAAIERAESASNQDSGNAFLVRALNAEHDVKNQPSESVINEVLPLSAHELLDHYRLAANFLIENPLLEPRIKTGAKRARATKAPNRRDPVSAQAEIGLAAPPN